MTELDERFDPVGIELKGTALVEASAGTGKTHAITLLVVRLVLEAGLEPSQILVMTFTEAATAELRVRIRRQLYRALDVLSGRLGELATTDPELVRICNQAGPLGLGRLRPRQRNEQPARRLAPRAIQRHAPACRFDI